MKFNSARLFGTFFIFSFVTYAIGISLMEIVQNTQTLPNEIVENKISLLVGAVSIAIFHTLFNVGLIVIMFNMLKSTSQALSIIYLVFGACSTFMLALGAVCLLLPIPISELITQSNNSDPLLFSSMLTLSSSANFYLYQIGMHIWGLGGLILCYLLYKSHLVPVFFIIWGYAGYLIFIVGCSLELSGIPYGVMFSIPGGLFEIIFSIWLITKGFNDVTSEKRITH